MRRIFFSICLIVCCIMLGIFIGRCDRDVIPWYRWVIVSVAIALNWIQVVYYDER